MWPFMSDKINQILPENKLCKNPQLLPGAEISWVGLMLVSRDTNLYTMHRYIPFDLNLSLDVRIYLWREHPSHDHGSIFLSSSVFVCMSGRTIILINCKQTVPSKHMFSFDFVFSLAEQLKDSWLNLRTLFADLPYWIYHDMSTR